MTNTAVLGKRLKEARLASGLSQEQLGIQADLDPMSASARMNRYELGNRAPAYETVTRFAAVLQLPAAYFYAAGDDEAKLLAGFHRLPEQQKTQLLGLLAELAN